MIEPNAAINAVQVGLTLTFVVMCVLLIKTWWPSVQGAVRDARGLRFWRAWSADEWLGVGIVIGFAGNIADNVYWGITWTTALYQLPIEEGLMESGPLSNIFSRQLVGILAVYCHLKAAMMMYRSTDRVPVRRLVLLGLGLSMALIFSLRFLGNTE